MTRESITLSHTELDRVSVIRAIISRQLTQAQAAQRLKLSVRQVKRLTRAYRTGGAAGMVSKHRGRCPGNALSEALRQRALALIRAHYIDFGPTFAQENSPHCMLAIARWRPCASGCSRRGYGGGNNVKKRPSTRVGPGWVSGYRLMAHRMTGLKGEPRAAP